MTDQEKDEDPFWQEYAIPYQEEFKGEYEFVNPVVVQQHLIKDIALTAQLTEQAESLVRKIANEEVQLAQANRKLSQFRRDIFSKYYSEITKSASSEIQDAFIMSKATEEGRLDELKELEETVEKHQEKLEIYQPRLDLINARLKAVDKKSDRATSYLNQERLLMKLEHNHNRMV